MTGSFIKEFVCWSGLSNTHFLLNQKPCCQIKMRVYQATIRLSENSARSRWSSKQMLSDHKRFCSIIWSVIGLINDPALYKRFSLLWSVHTLSHCCPNFPANIPWHGPSSHGRRSVPFPKHWFPPFPGTGLSQYLLLVSFPAPENVQLWRWCFVE